MTHSKLSLDSQKLILIADCIHYPISTSEIEKRIISTQVFNRLHNILQNSTVYFTYPADRISRFSHSLGVMHLVGKLYKYAISNAPQEDRERFFGQLISEINTIHRESEFEADVWNHFADKRVSPSLKELDGTNISDPLYLSDLPGSILDKKQRYAWIVSYQAVRLVALLHDLGHPPFSHITEAALGEVFRTLKTQENGSNELTSRQKTFLQIIGYYQAENKKLHEVLGQRLARYIINEAAYSYREESKRRFDTLVIKHLAMKILLESKSPLFRALHSLIDGDLDADRLDYVSRNLLMAGVGSSPIQYERLLQSFQLSCSPQPNGGLAIDFMPSVRALSTLEEFFTRRSDMYKYVTYHHRVVKTDGLLKQAIVQLSFDYLSEKSEPIGDEDRRSHLLPTDISGLWHLLDPAVSLTPNEIVDLYTQWDDAWLLSILRKHYFGLNTDGEQETKDRNYILRVQLEEILSNKKAYYSLVKRVDSFMILDNAYLNAMPQDFDWNSLRVALGTESIGKTSAFREHLLTEVETYFRDYKQAAESDDNPTLLNIRESRGFFLSSLQRLLMASGKGGQFGLSFADHALELLTAKYKLDDAILIPKMLNPGVTNEFRLSMDGRVIKLGEVSRIAAELDLKSKLFPTFFLYVYRSQGIDSDEVVRMRDFLGEALFMSFMNWVKK